MRKTFLTAFPIRIRHSHRHSISRRRPFRKGSAQTASGSDKPFVIELLLQTKWGHADEFIALFRKNHYPVLRKQVEMGRLLKVTAVAPSTTPPKTAAGTIASPSFTKMPPSPTMATTPRPFSTTLPRSGHLQEGIAAPLRNPRCPLGFAYQRRRPRREVSRTTSESATAVYHSINCPGRISSRVPQHPLRRQVAHPVPRPGNAITSTYFPALSKSSISASVLE